MHFDLGENVYFFLSSLGYRGEALVNLIDVLNAIANSEDSEDIIRLGWALEGARCYNQQRQMLDVLLFVRKELKLKVKTLLIFILANTFYVVLKEHVGLKRKHLRMLAERRDFLGVWAGEDGHLRLSFDLCLCPPEGYDS